MNHSWTDTPGSSWVERFGYDPASRELRVEFSGGGDAVVYDGVAPETHAAMLAAPSVGAFIHRHLKNRHKALIVKTRSG